MARFEQPDTSSANAMRGMSTMGALAFDGSQSGTPVGYYDYEVAEERWTWSDGVYELHGYAPQTVPATTALLLRHKHPDDMARAFEVLETAMRDGGAFSCYHRIVTVEDRVRSVLSVGRGVIGADGVVARVTGFFVDLTEVRRAETQAQVELALVQISQTRSVIDQAKGIIMVAVGCDAEAAFSVLRDYSSRKNVKVNDLARRLVASAARHPQPPDSVVRSSVLRCLDEVEAFSEAAG